MAMNRVALPTRRVLSNGFLSRFSSFSFAGPRKLNDILKQDMIADKTGAEVSELWHLYHESKVSWISFGVESLELIAFLIGKFCRFG